MTWQLTPCGVNNPGNAFYTTLEAVVGAFTADLGAASRPGLALVVAASAHRADGAGGTILVAGGGDRGCGAGRCASRFVVRARSVPPVEHGGQVGRGFGGGERRW